jgi:hypothetical protein
MKEVVLSLFGSAVMLTAPAYLVLQPWIILWPLTFILFAPVGTIYLVALLLAWHYA